MGRRTGRAGVGVGRVYSESNAPSHDSAIEHGCLTLRDCLGSVHLQLQHALMLRCPIARSCHTPQPVSSTEPFPVHVHSGPPLAPSFPAPCVYSQMQTEIHTAHCRLCANDGFREPVPHVTPARITTTCLAETGSKLTKRARGLSRIKTVKDPHRNPLLNLLPGIPAPLSQFMAKPSVCSRDV